MSMAGSSIGFRRAIGGFSAPCLLQMRPSQ